MTIPNAVMTNNSSSVTGAMVCTSFISDTVSQSIRDQLVLYTSYHNGNVDRQYEKMTKNR